MLGNTALRVQMPEPRFKVRLAIFHGLDQQNLMTDYSVNMSTGGIFVETAHPMPENTPLLLEFMLPVNDTLVTCKSRVAWTNAPGDMKAHNLPTGMGLQFMDLSLENVHAIRSFITEDGLAPTW
jgi:uncharacterized protein (TIGR02266 family)